MNQPAGSQCPLCGGDNRCCFGLPASGSCWCTDETFTQAVFDDLHQRCICKACLDRLVKK